MNYHSYKQTVPSAVRQFWYSDIQIKEDWILGRATFGNVLKPGLPILMCVQKCLEWESNMSACFLPAETFLMLKCCHENSPLIHGIVCTPKMILTTWHTYENNSIALYAALYEKPIKEVTIDVWKRILYDLLSAV